MPDLPTGTVTFLFTDIEGSTALAQQFPAKLSALLARHHAIMHQAIQAHGGHVFQITGDAFCAAFYTASDAVKAALDAQRGLQHEAWAPAPIKVRMGIHTGAAQAGAIEERAGGYVGYLTLTRVQRVMSAAYGGQVLLSNATVELVRGELPIEVSLRDMGEHRLKGLLNPEHLWQLVAPELRQDFPPLQSLNAIPNNLPVQLTSFIGREKDIAEVKRLLSVSRLVTLTGSGGAGKTRLSLQVSAEVIDEFAQGVWFIDLAPLTDPALVPQTAASVLGLREESGRPLLSLLADYLRAKTTLIILDNCEHLIEGCAQFADTLLHTAPQVKILASSREALSIGGEATYRVPSLAAPDPQRVPSLEVLTQYDAVRLFIERARAVMPSFEVNNTNAPAVAQLCYHLDGIPLALELAAARVRGLKVEQIAQRLDDRFRLLTGGGRTALPRQQTLRATIDWSHSLLTEQERILFCRLSVFAGGSTIEAAEAVCSGHGIESSEVLDLLLHLVDKSLILMDEQNAETRYHLSETIREYARDKLWEVSESQELRDRQLEFFSRLAEKVEPKLKGAEQLACLNQLELDLDNFRAALDWSLEEGDAELGIRLAGALWRFWVRRGYWSEGYERLKRALTRKSSTSTAARAKALGRAGDLAIKHRDIAAAHNLLMESLALSHELGDEGGAAFALYAFGLLARYQGDLVKQRSFFEESLSLYRKLDDRWGVALVLDFLSMAVMQSDPSAARLLREECLALIRKLSDYWGLMRVLTNSGELARFEGDYARAKALYEEAAVFGRELGAARWELANQQHGLGWVTLREGDNGRAAEHFKESILLQKEHGVITGLMASCVAGLGGVAAARGQFVRAAQLLGAVGAELTAREANGVHMELQDRVEIDRCVAEIRAQPDTAAFHAAWEAGQKMTLDEAIAYALEESGG